MVEQHSSVDAAAQTKLVHADSVEDAPKLLREAHAAGQAVLPCGKRSRQARIAPTAKADCWLSLARCDRLLWLDAEDQTCEVQAGMSMASLQQHLQGTGLELALMCRGAETGTLGGLFLSAEPSLLASSCGPSRDFVLGGGWILANGTAVRSGARVVKSVAGYDVTRLLLGSRGQLAINTSLILRLRPAPRELHYYSVEAASWPELRNQLAPARLLFPSEENGNMLLQFANLKVQHAALEPVDFELAEQQRVAFVGQMTTQLPTPSPWLEATAEACAPGAPHFGRRP